MTQVPVPGEGHKNVAAAKQQGGDYETVRHFFTQSLKVQVLCRLVLLGEGRPSSLVTPAQAGVQYKIAGFFPYFI
jgi:hypothetical protein